jgi:hypothetical protein
LKSQRLRGPNQQSKQWECDMLLKEGDKLLVAHRRLFEKDETRFFVGRVEACESGIVKATGHSYLRDAMRGQLVEKADERTKIFSLSSGTLMVYQLPGSVALDSLKFIAGEGQLWLTDGKDLTMNLAEHAHGGRV